jgi:hypothetical protein
VGDSAYPCREKRVAQESSRSVGYDV